MTHTISLLQAFVLGVVEGLTEFLPVSSTGHLTFVEGLMGLQTDSDAVTAFTAIIQVGAILAVIVYFWRDIVRLVRAGFGGLADEQRRRTFDFRFAWYVVAGTVPIGIAGFFGKALVTGPFRSLWAVAGGLLAWSAVMVVAERRTQQSRAEGDVTLRDALVVGVVQCAALVPGVSRSGATISAGLLRDLDRVSATRLSFFLSIPALVGAGLYELKDAVGANGVGWGAIAAGTAVSFVVAYASVAWLLRFVAGHSIENFVGYRVALGLAIIALLLAGVVAAT